MVKNKYSLLTEQEKINKIKKFLPDKSNMGRFFIPDDQFYVAPADDLGLQAMAKQLCMWLGFKPAGLSISFSRQITTDGCFVANEGGPAIVIHSRFTHNPYASAALLAEYLTQYYFMYRKRLALGGSNEEQAFITLAVVQSGLGLIALNRTVSYWQEHYPKLYYLFHKSRANGTIAARYSALVSKFAREYGLDLHAFSQYLCPWAFTALPIKSAMRPAGFAKAARERSRSAYGALVISLLVVASGMAMSGYILSQRPAVLPTAMRQEKEEIDILKSSYELCNSAVTLKRQNYDQNDFFISQNLEADRLRCVSLRNTYNYRTGQYNERLSHL